jgi:hypothetical protein
MYVLSTHNFVRWTRPGNSYIPIFHIYILTGRKSNNMEVKVAILREEKIKPKGSIKAPSN